MPTYDFQCENAHITELFCSISNKPDTRPCPECGAPSKQVFTTAPHVWKNILVLDYPGSKALKAGYVHTHGDPGASKVSIGAAGALNPKTKELHPLAHSVMPEGLRPG